MNGKLVQIRVQRMDFTSIIYQTEQKRPLISHSFKGVLGFIPFPRVVK